jgi:ATP-dependent Lhr-like helicase
VIDKVEQWYRDQGWTAAPFQLEVGSLVSGAASGLLHSKTGTGKTLAVWMGHLQRMESEGLAEGKVSAIWITPLKALANDLRLALEAAAESFGVPLRVEIRTGDTPTSQRAKQKEEPPHCLIITPESLALLTCSNQSKEALSSLKLVVVDEWHEFLSNKRGTLLELTLARLRRWNPGLAVWGLSATLGNVAEAAKALSVDNIVAGEMDKTVEVVTLLPENSERFPWGGHLGAQMLPQVLQTIDQSQSTLVFTNTRSQAELWFQSINSSDMPWADQVGLHHGSLDLAERKLAEEGLKQGTLKAVVATSSLDLGVDFSPVDCVIQVGSPKGVARLMQRAGRSGHRPGVPSRIFCVPTHGLELIDMAAAQMAIRRGNIEERHPLHKPFDVLAQHLVTCAAAGGFQPEEMLEELRTTYTYRNLTEEEWQWCLDFVERGGPTLKVYPDFKRVVERDGRYLPANKEILARHRMNIGTIVSDSSVTVKFVKGRTIGELEESFVARLRRGDCFLFSGRFLEFVRFKDMVCYVRQASNKSGAVVRWAGSRMPLSSELASASREILEQVNGGEMRYEEVRCAAPLLQLQIERSRIPESDELLIERFQTREGHHLFVYPIEGRLVHQGLASILAYRLSLIRPNTFSVSANDYGFELLSAEPIEISDDQWKQLFTPDNLLDDILGSLNSGEMARRHFREIARIAGLTFQSYGSRARSQKQLQSSSSLFYDVFAQFDPDHLLLKQARREVLEEQLEHTRLAKALLRLNDSKLVIVELEKPTPFSMPLIVERLRETISTEKIEDRIRKLIEED